MRASARVPVKGDVFRLNGLHAPRKRNLVFDLPILAIHPHFKGQPGHGVCNGSGIVGGVPARGNGRHTGGKHQRRAGECKVRHEGITDGDGHTVSEAGAKAGFRDFQRTGSQCSIDDILVFVPGERHDIAHDDGSGSGIHCDIERARFKSGSQIGGIAGARTLHMLPDAAGVADGKVLDASGYAVAEHIGRTRLIDLEQHRLFAAQVRHCAGIEDNLAVGYRSAVVIQNLCHACEVGKVICRSERSGSGCTIGTGSALDGFKGKISFHGVDELAHGVDELIGKNLVVDPRSPHSPLLFTVPADRSRLGFGDAAIIRL